MTFHQDEETDGNHYTQRINTLKRENTYKKWKPIPLQITGDIFWEGIHIKNYIKLFWWRLWCPQDGEVLQSFTARGDTINSTRKLIWAQPWRPPFWRQSVQRELCGGKSRGRSQTAKFCHQEVCQGPADQEWQKKSQPLHPMIVVWILFMKFLLLDMVVKVMQVVTFLESALRLSK